MGKRDTPIKTKFPSRNQSLKLVYILDMDRNHQTLHTHTHVDNTEFQPETFKQYN